MKIKNKLITTFLLLSLLPFIFIGGLSYYSVHKGLEEGVGAQLQSLAQNTIQMVDRELDEGLLDLKGWSYVEEMELIQEGDPDGLISQILIVFNENHKYYTHIDCVNLEGKLLGSSNFELAEKNYTDLPGFKKALAGESHVSDIHLDKAVGEYVISLSVPVKNRKDETLVIGALIADIKLATIEALVNEVQVGGRGASEHEHVMMVDSNGLVISAPRMEFEEGIRLEGNLVDLGMESAKLAVQGGTGYIVETSEHEKNVLIGYAHSSGYKDFPGLGWSVLVLQSPELAFGPAIHLLNEMLMLGVLVIMLILLVSVFIANKLSLPLNWLTDSAKLIAEGDLSQQVEIVSKDEIGELGKAFNYMARALKDRKQELVASYTELNEKKQELQSYAQSLEKEIDARKQALKHQHELNKLRADLLLSGVIQDKLKLVTDKVVEIFNVDFCRIWMIKPGDLCSECVHAEAPDDVHVCRYKELCLHLMASSGRYTHIDGEVHRRVPFGCYKIGLVASGKEAKFLTNNDQNDPRVHNNDWAREIGLVSFAGYRLLDNLNNPIGVMALFSKHIISHEEDILLESVANSTAQVIIAGKAEEALQELNEELEVRVEERTKELRDTQEQLVQAGKMAAVGQLAAGVSHELNNPLGGILGYSQFILEKAQRKGGIEKLEPKELQSAQTYVGYIERESQRCKAIVSNLLKFSRSSQSNVALLDINPVLEETIIFTNHQLELNQIKLVKDLAPDLPQVEGNEHQLQQVFTNLIINAQHAMREGGQLTVTSKLSMRKDQQVLEISFADTGCGIPKEHLSKLFDPFFTTKETGEGTGLGLSVSYGLIKDIGGDIEVKSEVDKGTVFTIILPVENKY